jgi:hypothetical protein
MVFTRRFSLSGWRSAVLVLLLIIMLGAVPVLAAPRIVVADNGVDAIKEILPNGTVITLASGALPNGHHIYTPVDVAFDSHENIIFTTNGGLELMKISAADGSVSTIAEGYAFDDIYGMAVDADDNIYVGDWQRVEKFFAENESGVVLSVPGINTLYSVAPDAEGNIFIAAGSGGLKERFANGTIVSVGSGFSIPGGVSLDEAGNLYITDSGHNALKKMSPEGDITTLATGFNNPQGKAGIDSEGNVYLADYGNKVVKKIYPNGTVETIATGFNTPWGLDVWDPAPVSAPLVAAFSAEPR